MGPPFLMPLNWKNHPDRWQPSATPIVTVSVSNRRTYQSVYPSEPLLNSSDRVRARGLPDDADREFVKSLMKPCKEPGKIASWISPPNKGINGQPFEFDYVRL